MGKGLKKMEEAPEAPSSPLSEPCAIRPRGLSDMVRYRAAFHPQCQSRYEHKKRREGCQIFFSEFLRHLAFPAGNAPKGRKALSTFPARLPATMRRRQSRHARGQRAISALPPAPAAPKAHGLAPRAACAALGRAPRARQMTLGARFAGHSLSRAFSGENASRAKVFLIRRRRAR